MDRLIRKPYPQQIKRPRCQEGKVIPIEKERDFRFILVTIVMSGGIVFHYYWAFAQERKMP